MHDDNGDNDIVIDIDIAAFQVVCNRDFGKIEIKSNLSPHFLSGKRAQKSGLPPLTFQNTTTPLISSIKFLGRDKRTLG